MAKVDYVEKFERFLGQRKNLGLIVLIGVLIIILPFILLRASSQRVLDSIREDQIKIQKGNKTVIISEDGTVEYITSDGIYYDSLDAQTVVAFFDAVRNLARNYLNKTPPKDTSNGYWITLYLDGQLVKVFVEGTNEEIEEILNDLSDDLSDDFLGELFEEFFSDEPSPTPGSFFASPTPSPYIFATPTPTPSGGFNPEGSGSIEEDCKKWQEQGLSNTIIFHTVCIESVTPTP